MSEGSDQDEFTQQLYANRGRSDSLGKESSNNMYDESERQFEKNLYDKNEDDAYAPSRPGNRDTF